MVYGPPLIKWVVEHVELSTSKTNTPLIKQFPLAEIKTIATLLPSTFIESMLSLYVALTLSLFICSLNDINYKKRKFQVPNQKSCNSNQVKAHPNYKYNVLSIRTC